MPFGVRSKWGRYHRHNNRKDSLNETNKDLVGFKLFSYISPGQRCKKKLHMSRENVGGDSIKSSRGKSRFLAQ